MEKHLKEFEKHLEQANKSIASGKSRTKNLVSKVEKMRTIGGLEPIIKDISDKLKVEIKTNAPVAQGIEQWFSKPSVGGSNPSGVL